MLKQIEWENEAVFEVAGKVLKSGGVIIGHTDTVMGLLAPLTPAGKSLLDRMKVRADKPYLLLVENKQKALTFLQKPLSLLIERIMDACWPGPVTLVGPASPDLPAHIQTVQGTIALRVPCHDGLLRLLHQFDALFSTSANKSGDPVPTLLSQVDETILKEVSLAVLNKQDTFQELASTIIEVTHEGGGRVIREGAYPLSLLQEKTGITFF